MSELPSRNGLLSAQLKVEDAPLGGVALRYVEYRNGFGYERRCEVEEDDLARLWRALCAAAQKPPQRSADVVAEAAPEAAPARAPFAWERVIVERANERIAIARGADGRFVLNAQRLVRRDNDGEMLSGVSVGLDPRDLLVVARAMFESLDPELANAPSAGTEILVEAWGTRLTIRAGVGRGALLAVTTRNELVHQFPIAERELLALAHAALRRREAVEP